MINIYGHVSFFCFVCTFYCLLILPRDQLYPVIGSAVSLYKFYGNYGMTTLSYQMVDFLSAIQKSLMSFALVDFHTFLFSLSLAQAVMLLLFLFYNEEVRLEFVVKEEFRFIVCRNMVNIQEDKFFISRARGQKRTVKRFRENIHGHVYAERVTGINISKRTLYVSFFLVSLKGNQLNASLVQKRGRKRKLREDEMVTPTTRPVYKWRQERKR